MKARSVRVFFIRLMCFGQQLSFPRTSLSEESSFAFRQSLIG